MRRLALLALALFLPTVFGVFGVGCSSAAEEEDVSAPVEDQALSAIATHATRRVCAQGSGRRHAFCMARVRTDLPDGYTPDFGATAEAIGPDTIKPATIAYGPSDLQAAYAVPAEGGEGITVAVVDAQDDPSAEADLAVYRAKYGLPPCTSANGCFKKVNASGGTTYPTPDYEWAIEIAMDIEAVSAMCPRCKILLVEAEENDAPASAPQDELDEAQDTAVELGAKFITNSWGSIETSTAAGNGILKAEAVAESTHYSHPGVVTFASAGDDGFATSPNNSNDHKGAGFPADIPQVFAVGGTSIVKSTTAARGWAEKVWNDGTDSATNSGCSSFFPKPSYQKQTACAGRLENDVSAIGDPSTGFNFYITYVDSDKSSNDYFPRGWNVNGGTSLASPITAGIFAAAGLVGVDPSFAYENEADFNDVTSGNNGTCKSKILCTARVGYDGPTGVGTPDATRLLGK